MAAHTNVCVIGLGSMGMGAARACLQAGLNTWGVDINPDNCRALLAAGAKGAGPSAVPFAAELDAVVGYRKYKPPFCSSSEVSYLKFPHSFTAQAPILTAGPA